jgi:hypothetical protein
MTENEMAEIEITPRDPGDPKATTRYKGRWYTYEEAQQLLSADNYRDMKKQWLDTEQGRLCMAFYEAFQAYKRYLEEHAYARWRPDGAALDFDEHRLFEEGLRMLSNHDAERAERDRKNLERAQRAARCQHSFVDGATCRAPRVKGKKLCRMHERMEEAKALKLDLGPMEDPDSIQVAIKKLQAAVIDGQLDHRQVASLSYLIQLAAWNVTRTSMAMREQ